MPAKRKVYDTEARDWLVVDAIDAQEMLAHPSKRYTAAEPVKPVDPGSREDQDMEAVPVSRAPAENEQAPADNPATPEDESKQPRRYTKKT